jgi:tetratricopeptide (TPR) repeat protein
MLVMIQLSPGVVQAQKKKKPETTNPPSGSIKAREAEFYFTEAEKYFMVEDYAKALSYYQRSLDILPENATIHYKMAEVFTRSDKQEDMVKASLSIEQALQYEKKNKYFYLLAAGIYSNLTRFDRAAQVYETMFREVPGTEEYLFELALIYQFSNKPAEAIKTYDRAEAYVGINETSSLQKLRLYAESGKLNEAINEGEKLLRAFPDEEHYAVAMAEFLAENNQPDKAIQVLERFMAENDSAPNSQVLLAGLYRDKGQEEKARTMLRKAFHDPDVDLTNKLIVLGTYNAEISQKRTTSQADKGTEEFTLELYSLLALEYPNEVNTYVIGGDMFLSLGRYDEAEHNYSKAVQVGEVSFEVWQNLLYLQAQRGDYDGLLKSSEQALEYYPNQSMLYYFSGMAFLRKNKFKEAIFSLESGKRLSASNPAMTSELNAMLGDAYNGTKEYEKSDKAYEEALAYNADNYVVLNNYAYYLALRKASLEKAEQMSARLVKNNPDNATFLDTHAWVLYTRQKYKEARKAMEKALGTGQANATHYEHYGDILFKLGEIDQAVQQWEQAKKMMTTPSETLNKKIANRKVYE